ncbi:transposase [Micromonospora sp. NBC_00362]|uniref:transposase n=1 Tax=Micromonospora sp. NBC_00362 TaxID=2975975 RepID=UPI00338F68E8
MWPEIESLLPPRPPRQHRFPGRKPFDDRKVLCGILFVLYGALSGRREELGFGSRMTCWRRLRDWNDGGVWQRLHKVLLGKLRAATRWTMRWRPR